MLDNQQANLALRIATAAPSARQNLSVTIHNAQTGNPTQITVYANGGSTIHDVAPSVFATIEGAVSTILSIAAVVTGQEYLYFAAAAIDAAESGQDFASGQDMAGILSLAQAVAGGILGGTGGTTPLGTTPAAPLSTAQVTAQAINVAAQGVGGVYGVVTSAESGNGVGILAGVLEAAAAEAAGIGMLPGQASQTLSYVSTALAAAGVATNMGSDFASGNLAQGLVDSLNLYLPTLELANATDQSDLSSVGVGLEDDYKVIAAAYAQANASQTNANQDAAAEIGTAVQQGLTQKLSALTGNGMPAAGQAVAIAVDPNAIAAAVRVAGPSGVPDLSSAVNAPTAPAASTLNGGSETVPVDGTFVKLTVTGEAPSTVGGTGKIDVSAQVVNLGTIDVVSTPDEPTTSTPDTIEAWVADVADDAMWFVQSLVGINSAVAAQTISSQQVIGIVNYLDAHAGDTSLGQCAHALNLAFRAEGVPSSVNFAKDFAETLIPLGFQRADGPAYTPHVGDIAVIQPTGKTSQAGHVDVWDGSRWVSDYRQPDYGNHVTDTVGPYISPVPGSPTGIWAGASYQIFRH